MAVKKTPDELAGDIRQLELKVRVRKNRMMSGLVHALRKREMFVRDLFVPHNTFGGVAGTRRGDRILKWGRKRFGQDNVRRFGEKSIQFM